MNDESIFAAALERPTPEERSAFLDEVCGADPEQRSRVEALLSEYDDPDSFFERTPIESRQMTRQTQVAAEPGTLIGKYKLLQQIGIGGFGVVYMAEQQEPVQRRVAIKIIKPGMDSEQVIARFEAERQALAMMDHPNIAKVLDAGTTESGRPFFVMELVKGVPITKFCDDSRLTTQQRLELFIPVCYAVQHAHQKGIIHRDIKPSNILVSLYDGHAVPKVIDFGVAKAIEQRLTDKTMFTRFGQIIGTLEYMSPEQAELNQLDVDTRTDVYSLGAVLYELLTGETPIERKRLTSAAFDEMLRIIREVEPARPSQRLISSDNLKAIAVQRDTEPAILSHSIRGELDWIVMKAVAKQRAQRYANGNDLARDLERFLADLPVEAGPPSATYQLRKFLYKNRKPLSVAAGFVLLLLVGTITSSWQAIRANKNATVANAAEAQAAAERDKAIDECERAERHARESRNNLYIAHMRQVQLEWERNNVARVVELLDKYRTPSPANDELRGWEWRYWDRMCHLDLRTLKAHAGVVYDVDFSSDGSQLASAGEDGTIRIWDVGSGRLEATIEGQHGAVKCLAFHPHNGLIASGGDDKIIRIWNTASNNLHLSLEHVGPVSSLAFSPDGKKLAAGSLQKLQRNIWDLESGKIIHSLSPDPPNRVHSVKFNNEGNQLICAASRDVEFWDLSTGKLVNHEAHAEEFSSRLAFKAVTAVVTSSDQRQLATCSQDHKVKIWDARTHEEIHTLSGHASEVTDVIFHPVEPRLYSSSHDNTIRVWDTRAGTSIRTIRGHTRKILKIAISSDGMRLASASSDGTIKIWDANSDLNFRYYPTPSAHYRTFEFAPDSTQLAVAAFDGIGEETDFHWVDVGNAASFRAHKQFRGHSAMIASIAINADQSLIAAANNDEIIVWDLVTGHETLRIPGNWKSPRLEFSPHSRWLLLGSYERAPAGSKTRNWTQRIFDVGSGELLQTYSGMSAAFSSKSGLLAIAEDTALRILDLETGVAVKSWDIGEIGTDLRFSPNVSYLTGHVGNSLVIWDAETGQQVSVFDRQLCVGIEVDNHRLFTEDAENVHVWNVRSGDLMCSVPKPNSAGFGTKMTPDATLFAFRRWDSTSILDLRDDLADVREQREALTIVAQLLQLPSTVPPFITRRKTELLNEVHNLRTINDTVRQHVMEVIEEVYTPREESGQFEAAAQVVVENPDAMPEEYRQALEWTKIAHELWDREGAMGTMGVVLYRLGRYRDALQPLEKGYEYILRRDERLAPIFLCFMAMTHHHLGNDTKAKELLQRLRDPNQAGRYITDPIKIDFYREAVTLIEGESNEPPPKP